MWQAARERGLIGQHATANVQPSWSEVAVERIDPATPVLVVFSYFCASQTLTLKSLESLAQTVLRIGASRIKNPLVLAYMNSTNPLVNTNYEVFKQKLGLDPDQDPPVPLSIEYRKKRGGSVVGREVFVQQVLRLPRR